jgi:hypothetical protein
MNKRPKIAAGLAGVVLAAILCSACSVMYLFTGRPAQPPPACAAPERVPLYHHAGWIIARGSLHNHTIMSDGVRSPEGLLEQARCEGIAVLAYSDHREGDISLGPGLKIPINGVERSGYQ